MNKEQGGFNALVVVLAVVVAGAIGYTGWYVRQSRQAAPKTTLSSTYAQSAYQNTGWNKTVTSGKGAFRITFPDGWNVARDTNSDAFMIGGEAQPTVKAGTPAVVTSAPFGSDGPVVLFIFVSSGADSAPRGAASDFLLENGKTNPVQGKKYVYEYPADLAADVGGQRIKGDRDYAYVFDLGGGKHLEVLYSVYASDPRNNIQTIDELLRTIRLNP
jgi:hypothetical protein